MSNKDLLKKAKAATTAAPVKEGELDGTVLKEGIAPSAGTAALALDSSITEGTGATEGGSTVQATGGELPPTITAAGAEGAGSNAAALAPDASMQPSNGSTEDTSETYGVVLYHLKSKEGVVPVREYFTVFPPVSNGDLEVKEYHSEHQIKVNIKDKDMEQEALHRFRSEVHSQQQLSMRGFGRR